MHFLVTTALAQILEVSSAIYPEKNGIFAPENSFILPSQNTFVQFGGQQALDKTGNRVLISEENTKNFSKIVCGPSPFINTMNCFSTAPVGFLKSVPIPGDVSTTPVLFENSWIVGTTKGFLLRVKTKSTTDTLPDIDPQSTELWGSSARQIMDDFVPKTIYRDGSSKEDTSLESLQNFPKNYVWVFPTSSPFVGTPIIHNNLVYVLTANQSLYAIDFITGKFIWSVKISSNVTFSLENVSLRVTDHAILIGTTHGHLLALDPGTGHQIYDININNDNTLDDNVFSGVTAPPLILPDSHVIISNASSETKRISLDNGQIQWSYAEGSIATPLLLNPNTIILTTSSGKVVNVNAQTGTTNWSVNLHKTSPLVDATLTHDKTIVLVATKRGELIAIDSATGKILAQNRAIGTTIGFFFKTQDQSHDACLSFSTGSFRCFRVKL